MMILFQQRIIGSKEEATEQTILMIAIPAFLLAMSLCIQVGFTSVMQTAF